MLKLERMDKIYNKTFFVPIKKSSIFATALKSVCQFKFT